MIYILSDFQIPRIPLLIIVLVHNRLPYLLLPFNQSLYLSTGSLIPPLSSPWATIAPSNSMEFEFWRIIYKWHYVVFAFLSCYASLNTVSSRFMHAPMNNRNAFFLWWTVLPMHLIFCCSSREEYVSWFHILINILGNPYTSLVKMQISGHYGKQYGDVSRIFKGEPPSCNIVPGCVGSEMGTWRRYLQHLHCCSNSTTKVRVLLSLLNH